MKHRTRTEGSILIDTLVAVLICAVIMTALVPLAIRLIRLEASLIDELVYIFTAGSSIW